MMNRKSSRLLTTMILAAALATALGSVAQAGRDPRASWRPTVGSNAPKPGVGPLSGEPDAGGSGPLPPKEGHYQTGVARRSTWAQRIHWSVRVVLLQSPKRFP